MKILQVITLTELGGAQSVVANLANELAARHEVIVAGGEGDGKMWSLMAPEVRRESVPGLVRRISPLNELKALWSLRRLYRQYRPDVVQLHSSKAGLLGRIAFPRSRTIYTVHGFDSIRLAFRKFLPLEKALQSRARFIVGVSRYDEANMQAEGIRGQYIYNGVPEPVQLAADPLAAIRAKHPAGVVLCIARLAVPKNHELFLALARRLPQYAFVWVGNQQAPDFEVPANCYFLGNIPGAGSYCHYADLFLLPSNYEGLPMVILEALACGCPVVASKVGGIPEILDGTNGFACPNDPALMTKAIEQVLANRAEFAQNARASYLRSFTVSQMAAAYEQLYLAVQSSADAEH